MQGEFTLYGEFTVYVFDPLERVLEGLVKAVGRNFFGFTVFDC